MKYLKLKEVLKEQGRTQVWLSEKLEKHFTTVSKWCNHTDVPSIATIYEIAYHLRVQPADLLCKIDLNELAGQTRLSLKNKK